MAHYRKIDTRIWNDAKFRALSSEGKLAFLYLLTCPNMTALGAMRGTIEGLSAELRVPPEAFTEVFGEAFDEGLSKGCLKHVSKLAIYDQEAACIYVPNFVKYQAAESPNVVRAWAKTLEYIPECRLKILAVQGAQVFVQGMSLGFRKAFQEAFSEPLTEGIPESVSSKQLTVSSNPASLSKSGGGYLVDVHSAPSAQKIGNGGSDDF